ncbi:MAG: hypothetical protein ACXVDD_02115 [Polyangia bacterium]
MTKLMSLAALLFAVGCGVAPSSSESTEPLTLNGLCYNQYHACVNDCDPTDDLCNCLCHNSFANCTVPKGRLYKCPPDAPNGEAAALPADGS